MRSIKSLADVQVVLNQLLNWQTNKDSKDWDFSGLRIKNASASKDPNDYVIRSELHPTALAAPPISSAPQTQAQVSNPPQQNSDNSVDQYFTIVFATDAPSDGYETPPYNAGINRDGVFIDVWVRCGSAPISNPASINFNVNGNPLLTVNVQIPVGAKGPIHTGLFVSPLPVLGLDTGVTMKVITASSIALLSGGLVVRRNLNPRT